MVFQQQHTCNIHTRTQLNLKKDKYLNSKLIIYEILIACIIFYLIIIKNIQNMNNSVIRTLYNDWKQKIQRKPQIPLRISYVNQLIINKFSIASQQFHQVFLYGQKMTILHKGKPKQFSVYMDNNRQKILWISSKTKAFLIDLYFTIAVFKQSNYVKNMPQKKYYFSLRQLEEQIIFIFNNQQQKNKYFNLFKIYISQLKRQDPKYNLYFSNINKLLAMSITKNGTNHITFNQIKQISKFVGLTNQQQNQQILNTCLKYNEIKNIKHITKKCLDNYFMIQFCNCNLQPIFQLYSYQKIGDRKKDPNAIFKKVMSKEQFRKFLRDCQKESEYYIHQIMKIYNQQLSFFDFCLYLYDSQLNHASRMQQTPQNYPLKDYFCYSSHNTYLSGNQFNSDCKVQRYSQDMQNGIKCLELDIHDRFGILVVTHAVNGAGFCKPITFEDVIKVIQIYSEKCRLQQIEHYPIILSLQNHASNQSKQSMLDIMAKYFGNKIYFYNNQKQFPTLSFLTGKIVIKTNSSQEQLRTFKQKYFTKKTSSDDLTGNRDLGFEKYDTKIFQNQKLQEKYEDFIKFKIQMQKNKYKFNSRHQQLQQIYIPLSSMSKVTAIFKSKEGIKGKKLSQFQCTSLTNEKVMKKKPQQLIRYTQTSWLRTYPIASQIQSSNYDPIPMMAIGAQIVALNTQTKDYYAWLLNGYFCGGHATNNSRHGYVLKPSRLRMPEMAQDKQLHKLKIDIIQKSGQNIQIKFFGLFQDMKRNNVIDANEFIYQNPDESFLVFNIGTNFRQCIAIRWIIEGYRIIEGKSIANIMDCGKRILLKITKTILKS